MMTIWLLQLLLLTITLLRPVKPQNLSTIRTRITTEGLKFFSKIGHHIVDHEIWKITFPEITLPIESGPGTGEVNVTQLAIRTFKSPKFTFKLAPPNGIVWQSNGGSTKLDGQWNAVYNLIAPIYLTGYVKTKVDDIRVYMQTNVLVRDERPQIEVTTCSMNVEHVDVHISGGVIPWIVNLFRAQLAVFIKKTIHGKLCEVVRSALVDEINGALATLPTNVEIIKNLYLSYSCKQQPVTTTEYIQGEMISYITYGQNRCMLPMEPMDDKVDSTTRMAHIWISEYVPNCLLQTLYNSEILNFSITKETGDGRFASFLRTDCALLSVCIGEFLPTLRQKYPNRTVDLFIQSAEAPYVSVHTNSIRIFAGSTVDLYLSPWKQQTSRLARLVMNSTTYVVPGILHRKLVGNVGNVVVSVREHDSTVGQFSPQVLELLENLLAKAIRVIGGVSLKIGIPLPLVSNVTISDDAQILAKDSFIRIDFNFIYI